MFLPVSLSSTIFLLLKHPSNLYPFVQHTRPEPAPKHTAAVAAASDSVGVLISNELVPKVVPSASKMLSTGRRSTNTETLGQILPLPEGQTALEK